VINARGLFKDLFCVKIKYMINIDSKKYKFCPYCGKNLKTKTEEFKKIQYCSVCNWIYYPHVGTATGAIIINNNKVLMVKRGREPYKGTWMFPAGFVNYGEHPEDTLIREVKEETGLMVDKYIYHGLFQATDDPRSPGHFTIFYKVFSFSGQIFNNDKDENMDIKWFFVDDLPDIGWESHKKAAVKLCEGII